MLFFYREHSGLPWYWEKRKRSCGKTADDGRGNINSNRLWFIRGRVASGRLPDQIRVTEVRFPTSTAPRDPYLCERHAAGDTSCILISYVSAQSDRCVRSIAFSTHGCLVNIPDVLEIPFEIGFRAVDDDPHRCFLSEVSILVRQGIGPRSRPIAVGFRCSHPADFEIPGRFDPAKDPSRSRYQGTCPRSNEPRFLEGIDVLHLSPRILFLGTEFEFRGALTSPT